MKTLESTIRDFLTPYPPETLFKVRAHELLHDGEGWSSNDRFTLASAAPRDEIPAIARARWEVFKVNYSPRARVSDLADIGYDPAIGLMLECDFLPFLDIEPLTE